MCCSSVLLWCCCAVCYGLSVFVLEKNDTNSCKLFEIRTKFVTTTFTVRIHGTLGANFVQNSYEIRTNFVRISHEFPTNLVRISCELRTNFVPFLQDTARRATHVMSCHGALEPSSAGPPSGRPSAERLAVTHTRTPMEWAPGKGGRRAPRMARRREAPGPSKVHHGQASGRSETPVPPTGPGFLGTGGSHL